jgi:hypothetical protein
MMQTATLLDCGHEPSPHSDFTTGYGRDAAGLTYCYACCADSERASMAETGRATLYLVKMADTSDSLGSPRPTGYEVTNWPGMLRFPVHAVTRGRHNFAGTRTDGYFRANGEQWRFTVYGDNTQIAHCRRIKG